MHHSVVAKIKEYHRSQIKFQNNCEIQDCWTFYPYIISSIFWSFGFKNCAIFYHFCKFSISCAKDLKSCKFNLVYSFQRGSNTPLCSKKVQIIQQLWSYFPSYTSIIWEYPSAFCHVTFKHSRIGMILDSFLRILKDSLPYHFFVSS